MPIFVERYEDLSNQESEKIAQIGWQNNFGPDSGTLEFGYIFGYKEAADILVSKVQGPLNRDSLVFPIVYNYRHYLELLLKHIANSKKINLKKNHDLSKLWNELKTHMGESAAEKRIIEYVVLEFNKFDERSTNFRYSDKFSKTNNLYVDLAQLKDAMENIDDILYLYYA